MNKIEKGTKFIIGDEECGYGIYIAIKDIDLENAIYEFDEDSPRNLLAIFQEDGAEHLIDVLRQEEYVKPEEQFPYLNLCNENVILENYPNY